MKKIIRISESKLVKIIRKIINEGDLMELGHDDFGNIESLDCVESIGGLHVGISRVNVDSRYGSGINFLVSYYYDDENKVIFGYGPRIEPDMGEKMICKIGLKFLNDMYDEFANV